MDALVGRLSGSVSSFFAAGDAIPWCDRDIVAECEKEVSQSDSEEKKKESITRLSWCLVHSRQQEDVQRGIAMLEVSVSNSKDALERREKLYLLAVGYYRKGNYARSCQLADMCLELQPDWRQAQTLKKLVEDQIAKDGLIGMGIAATAIGLVVGGIAALVRR